MPKYPSLVFLKIYTKRRLSPPSLYNGLPWPKLQIYQTSGNIPRKYRAARCDWNATSFYLSPWIENRFVGFTSCQGVQIWRKRFSLYNRIPGCSICCYQHRTNTYPPSSYSTLTVHVRERWQLNHVLFCRLRYLLY